MFSKKILLVIFGIVLLSSCHQSLPIVEKVEEPKHAKSEQIARSTTAPNAKNNVKKPIPVFVFAKSPYLLGSASAPLNILSFVDYNCANCARLHRLLPRLLKDAEFKDLVSISYRQYPLRNYSIKPAKVALAAGLYGNEKFWAMSDKLFAADGELHDKNYLGWAKEIGIEPNKFARDLVEKEAELIKAINQDIAMVAKIKKLGAPVGLFVDGHLFRGQITFENLKTFIRAVKTNKEKAADKIAPLPVK